METQTPDITTGFIQMVEAYKAKPELEKRIAELESILNDTQNDVRRLNNEVIEKHGQLEAASQDKERLTRERDEAMFRTLELEEKTSQVNTLLAQLNGVVNPQPVAKAEPEVQMPERTENVAVHEVFQDSQSFPVQHDDMHNDWMGDKGSDLPSSFQSDNSGDAGHHKAEPEPVAETRVGPSEPKEGPKGTIYDHETGTYVPDNRGRSYHDKPWWVNDNDWRRQGGDGPHEGGSWEAPWERTA